MAVRGEARSTTFAILVVDVRLHRDLQVTLVMITVFVNILWLKVIVRRVGIFNNFNAECQVVVLALLIALKFLVEIRNFDWLATVILACNPCGECTVQS